MEIKAFAKLLRERQISRQSWKEVNMTETAYKKLLASTSDEEVIESYVKCNHCGKHNPPMPYALKAAESSSCVEEWFEIINQITHDGGLGPRIKEQKFPGSRAKVLLVVGTLK